jgi:hypothetical protein
MFQHVVQGLLDDGEQTVAQLPVESKIARAHFVLWTEGPLAAHAQQVARVASRL